MLLFFEAVQDLLRRCHVDGRRTTPQFTMFHVVRLSLSALRVVAHASFFLEAQRILLRIVRPTQRDHLRIAEQRILSRVRNPVRHRWVPDANGNMIHVIECAPTLPSSTQRKMVLLHGHSMSAAFWFRNLDDLVSLGYHVYAIDLLGWGRSHRPRFHGKTPDDTVNWYLSSLRDIVCKLSLSSFTLVGHSLGAYLSMEYTKRAPHTVRQLVLVSPAAAGPRIPFSRALYFSLPPQSIVRRGGLLGFLLFLFKYPRCEMYVRDRLRDYTYHLATQFPPSGEVAVLPIIKFSGMRRAECTRPLIQNLQLFRNPVHIICGETDSSMPIESVHDLYAEMKRQGFNVDISVVSGTDHCPQLESPKNFYRIISELGDHRSQQIRQ